jgi:hypothetical protein
LHLHLPRCSLRALSLRGSVKLMHDRPSYPLQKLDTDAGRLFYRLRTTRSVLPHALVTS